VGRARIIVVGSINVDLVVRAERLPAPGETVTGGDFSRHGGGKGANQAVAAARLGAAVTMIGAVGDDDLGEEAVRLLAAEGIDVGAVRRLAGVATGVALIAVDAAGENQIAVASGANARLGAEVAEAMADAGDAVVLLGHEVPEEAVTAGARAAGGPVVLNPAPSRALSGEVLARAPVLTPNASEARDLAREGAAVGAPERGERDVAPESGAAEDADRAARDLAREGGAAADDPERAARALAARSGAPVLVTLGSRGVLVLDGERAEVVPPPRVEVVDTTGAGDAFNGALAVALSEGRPLDAAARFAVTAAALSTRVAGAREGMPGRDEVEAAL
jgi:ribokinase